jgi:hypothetical protein
MGDSGWEGLRRRDLQSLSEITSPKALDEKRPKTKGDFFLNPAVGEQSHARSSAAAVQGPLA